LSITFNDFSDMHLAIADLSIYLVFPFPIEHGS
jgi:hypothetical protein